MNQNASENKKLSSTESPKYVKSAIDYFSLCELLTSQEENLRQNIRNFFEKEIAPFITDSLEAAVFPDHLIPPIRDLGIFSHFVSKPFGKGTSTIGLGLILCEISRVDASLSYFALCQGVLAMYTIDKFGSEEQKRKFLPAMINLDLISGWGLTELNIGSDPLSMESKVTKVPNGDYILNGNKRWVGNGDKNMVVVWAKNVESGDIEGFIVDMKSSGIISKPIKYKLSVRMVQNCQIEFNNVLIPAEKSFLMLKILSKLRMKS